MKTVKLLGLIGVVLLLMAVKCEKAVDYYVTFVNKSNKAIYYLPSFYYPDTMLKKSEPPISSFKIKPNGGQAKIPDTYFFANNEKLIIFILDADTVEMLPWDTIVDKYLILRRYEVTCEDVERMNRTLTYP